MNSIVRWRITTWWGKLLYAIGAYIVLDRVIGWWLAGLIGPDHPVELAYEFVSFLAAFIVGARLFRGRDEDPVAPRPWWQMTARPKLSRRLGNLLAAATILGVFLLVAVFGGFTGSLSSPVTYGLDVLTYAVLAYLYLNSAYRLKAASRVPAPAAD